MYGKGVSREGGVLDIGVDNDIVKKSGAWYTYEGEQLGQGRENAKQFLQDNPEIMIEISERIRTQMGIGDSLDDVAAPVPTWSSSTPTTSRSRSTTEALARLRARAVTPCPP